MTLTAKVAPKHSAREPEQPLAGSLEQQKAISEILRVMSSSPGDVKPVLDVVAERAAFLCEAPFARISLVDGDVMRPGAEYSIDGTPQPRTVPLPLKRSSILGRAVLDRRTVHHDDVVPLLETEYPDAVNARRLGLRAVLAVPLMREDNAYGAVFLFRREPRAFSQEQVALVETFAQQAAIAIDNARLYRASRQAEESLRQLNESLEQRVSAEIAERMRAEELLRQAQKMEAVGQLTGGVAHDFNNLLTAVCGGADTLRRLLPEELGPHGDRIRRAVRMIEAGSERAATLTQRLLAFARRQALDSRPLDANKLVAGMSELLRRTLGEAVAIETVLAGGLWRTMADPNHLESALLNLAVNARDAMPNGGRLTIETANTYLDETYAQQHEEVRSGQYVMIAVSDTGTGMTKATMERVFEPFFTTKEVGQGTGLGLSQVYGFIKQSDGHIKLYSELDHGTVVKLYLPRLIGEGQFDAEVEATVAATNGGSGELVLVVEDDEAVRAYSTEALRELGYRVLAAANGWAGLELLARFPAIRLLFTDVGLPGGMTGRQLADKARQQRPDLLVLFTTGYARNAIVHGGILDPGTHLLPKPFTYAALSAKIRTLLEG